MQVYFRTQKNDQDGSRSKDPRAVYANPMSPEALPPVAPLHSKAGRPNKEKGYPPLKMLAPQDMPTPSMKKRYSDLKNFMSIIEKAAQTKLTLMTMMRILFGLWTKKGHGRLS